MATLVLLTIALVRTPSSWLAGAMGQLLAPAGPGLSRSTPRAAWLRSLSVSGKVQCGINRDWPSTCPDTGQLHGSICPAGEAGVTTREGQDTEVVGWGVLGSRSLVWVVSGRAELP